MATPRKKALQAVEEQSFDLDQARAIRRDREGAQFRFTFNAGEFVCLPMKEWPITLTETAAEGKLLDVMDRVLGDQFDRFMEGDPSMGDVKDLIDAMGKFSGVGTAGE